MVLSNFPRLSRNLPLVNLFIASSALGFQICVLYPWHLQIDESHNRLIKRFNDLSNEMNSLQQEQEYELKQLNKLQHQQLQKTITSTSNSTSKLATAIACATPNPNVNVSTVSGSSSPASS